MGSRRAMTDFFIGRNLLRNIWCHDYTFSAAFRCRPLMRINVKGISVAVWRYAARRIVTCDVLPHISWRGQSENMELTLPSAFASTMIIRSPAVNIKLY